MVTLDAKENIIMIIDHLGIAVSDFRKSKAFFLKALEPLGIGLVMEVGEAAGLGKGGKPDFWIAASESGKVSEPVHVAFVADSRAEVQAFYKAALAAGGRDNGAPGIRAHYHPTYYGAFVFDLDGNNIEAVCHRPES
jgi:catechol 2,3-dioxygenase-like lactoylglutathione lyase family enzyme